MFNQRMTVTFFANFLLFLLAVFAILSFCLPLPKTVFGMIALRMFQGGCLGGFGGALADWYAVTALFKKPLGLNLPHTNIIAKNKNKIADNIAHFVVREFLNEAEILALIQNLDIGKKTNQKIFQFLFEEKASKGNFAKSYLLEEVLLSAENFSLASRLLRFNLKKHRHKIIAYVEERVKEQGGSLLGWAVGSSIGRRVVGALERELKKIDLANPAFLQVFSEKKTNLLRTLAQKEQKEEFKTTGLKSAPSVWKKKKTSLEKMFLEFSDSFSFEEKIDTYIREYIRHYMPEIKARALLFLQTNMQKWSGEDITQRLEKAVGGDLAYIRVNGALVGFLTSALMEGGIFFVQIFF